MVEKEKDKVEDATEFVHCALVNLDNMKSGLPTLELSPFFAIVRMQLVEGLKLLGREVE